MPRSTSPYKSIADAAAEPLRKAYLAGGFGLTLLTLGAALMFAAFFMNRHDPVAYTLLTTGVFLILFTVLYVYFKELRRLGKAGASIKSNKELIDAVQQTAVALTDVASDLQLLVFRHAQDVTTAINLARPYLEKIPIVSKIFQTEAFIQVETLSATIFATTQKARQVIDDLRTALTEANATHLKKYLEEVKKYRETVERVLSGRPDQVARATSGGSNTGG